MDSYCILEDDDDKDNAKFKCYAYTENMTSYNNTDEELVSNYMVFSDSSSNSTDNGNSGAYFNRKKSSGGLSGGAIAGIIIGCLAVLIAIIATIICVNKRPPAAAPFDRQSESHNHIQISNMSGQYPVKV